MRVPLQDLKREYDALARDVEEGILRVASSGGYVMGPQVEGLEEDLACLLGARHVVSCASGTDALFLALAALGVRSGDEVITSPFTFFSTASSIARLGATPVFCDLDDATLAISADGIRRRITERTVAVVPVHLYGQPADMEAIQRLAKEKGLRVVEDAAQAIGAQIGNRMIGTWGDLSCFSFYPTKNLGAMGDGGAVSTEDEGLARVVRLLRSHGSEDAVEYPKIGINSRLDAIQAAILRVKIPRLKEWTAARQETARFYDEAFEGLPLRVPARREGMASVYHQYTIRTSRRDDLRGHLAERGIGAGVYYPVPLHLQPCFRHLGHGEGSFPVAETAAREVLSLPVHPYLTRQEMESVAEGVRSFYL